MTKWPLFCAAALAIGAGAVPSTAARAADAAPKRYCDAPVYHQLDYWLGDWDTYRVDASGTVPPDAKPVARNRIDRILDGCVLHEVYRRADGYTGESFTIYDATRHVWHQSWVTNQDELLLADGVKHGDGIALTGATRDAQGAQLLRVTWTPQGRDLRETAVQSRDGGRTWTPLFDILFRPHPH
jgi:hypothetical protein